MKPNMTTIDAKWAMGLGMALLDIYRWLIN
jgi:hypothetical protein